MLQNLILDVLVDTTRKTVPLQKENGRLSDESPSDWGYIGGWAIAYTQEAENNPCYRDPKVLEAIIRAGDLNARSVTEKGTFPSGEVDWRFYAWFEAMDLIRNDLDERRLTHWREKLVLAGEAVMRVAIDMDTFDGQVPNHGIWGHAMLHRIGQLCDRPDFVEMAVHALHRDFDAQTADGCFREGTTSARMAGTPVTGYNLISAAAIEQYHFRSGDPKALKALEKAWKWWRNILLPDRSSPPNFDFRQVYHPEGLGLNMPATWANYPEGRAISLPLWQQRRDELLNGDRKPMIGHYIQFLARKYPLYEKEVEPRNPDLWREEYWRMQGDEACVRRRRPWAVALSGMSNLDLSTNGLRLWSHERQDCVAVWHEAKGLLMGSAHGLAQEEFSTFVFYEAGDATYLHNKAHLKSTPPLDTLLLRYGRNVGAVSVDSTAKERAKVIFSLDGERGRSAHTGAGFPKSSLCAKAHLTLRCQSGDAVQIIGKDGAKGGSWALSDDPRQPLHLRIEAGETLDLDGWSITCPDGFWEFRWPVRSVSPYTLFDSYGEQLGLLEVTLYHKIGGRSGFKGPYQRPTAEFEVRVENR